MSFKIHSVIKCMDNYACMNFDFGSQKKIFSIACMIRRDLEKINKVLYCRK